MCRFVDNHAELCDKLTYLFLGNLAELCDKLTYLFLGNFEELCDKLTYPFLGNLFDDQASFYGKYNVYDLDCWLNANCSVHIELTNIQMSVVIIVRGSESHLNRRGLGGWHVQHFLLK